MKIKPRQKQAQASELKRNGRLPQLNKSNRLRRRFRPRTVVIVSLLEAVA